VRRLYTRGKYLGIKGDAHELFYGILTFLSEESKNVRLRKKEDRDEREFRAFNKIILLIVMVISLSISKSFTTAVLSVNILSISNSRIF
jgi:hypothetical protein